MRTTLYGVAAAALLGSACTASAQPLNVYVERYPYRTTTRIYTEPANPRMRVDEVRDYRMEQAERRHEMEREALRFRQRAERRVIDPADDEDSD